MQNLTASLFTVPFNYCRVENQFMYCHLFQVPTNEIGDYGSDSEEENHEVEHYLKGVYTKHSSFQGNG